MGVTVSSVREQALRRSAKQSHGNTKSQRSKETQQQKSPNHDHDGIAEPRQYSAEAHMGAGIAEPRPNSVESDMDAGMHDWDYPETSAVGAGDPRTRQISAGSQSSASSEWTPPETAKAFRPGEAPEFLQELHGQEEEAQSENKSYPQECSGAGEGVEIATSTTAVTLGAGNGVQNRSTATASSRSFGAGKGVGSASTAAASSPSFGAGKGIESTSNAAASSKLPENSARSSPQTFVPENGPDLPGELHEDEKWVPVDEGQATPDEKSYPKECPGAGNQQ